MVPSPHLSLTHTHTHTLPLSCTLFPSFPLFLVWVVLCIFNVDPSGDQLNRAFMQYTFSNKPHPIIQKPHGNTKNAHAQPFIRTTPSTLQKLKQCIKVQPPKQAVASVTKQKGGIIKLNIIGYLPRNWKQAYNITSRKSGEDDDALVSVMAMCKLTMGKGDDPFVRIVTSAPEPVCTKYQFSTLWYWTILYRSCYIYSPQYWSHIWPWWL